jgi:hypothetical protein
VITADRDALRRDFPLKPFAIRHRLAGHPLLMLPRIAQLASELPRDLIEYNSGKVAISQDPDAIPSVDLDPVEVVKSIETAGAWMVLKRVENSPEYRALLEDTLLSVARARGFNSLLDAGFEQTEAAAALAAAGHPATGVAHRVLAALSPIANAEADPAPTASARHAKHHGKTATARRSTHRARHHAVKLADRRPKRAAVAEGDDD